MGGEEEEEGSSFKARVDKIFGSLSSKSAWSLTGQELSSKREKQTLSHHEEEEEEEEEEEDQHQHSSAINTINNISINNKKKNRNNDFADDDDDDGGGGGDGDDEEWDIRTCIGLDPTLDYEAEEDEYDKVAEGREDAGERLYMRDVAHHGPYLNSHNVLPDSVYDVVKDSRANHLAAKARLEEDKADSLRFRQNPLSRKAADGAANKPKPVLKTKDNSSSSKSQRRVRFDPYCKNKPEEGNSDNLSTDMPAVQTTALDYQAWVKNSPAIPDYLLNPSKYTRYTFDSTSEVDDTDMLNYVKTSSLGEVPPHQIKFTPKKKESGPTPMDSSSSIKQEDDVKHLGSSRIIAAVENQIIDDMDVEDNEQGLEKTDDIKTENQKPNRHYRPRPKMDDTIS